MAGDTSPKLMILPLTPGRWPDLETLFGPRGPVSGCWCMWWRVNGTTFRTNAGEQNKADFKRIVDDGSEPGLIGYEEGHPVAWVSLAPREAYAARFNNRSPVFKPLDDLPVWSILCFYVKPDHRRQGLAKQMLRGAIDYARQRGVEWLEAIPKVVTQPEKDDAIYVGTVEFFVEAGFVVAGQHHRNRPFMRLKLSPNT